MAEPQSILITAFEPSGDALAAGLIAELRRRRPEMKIWALGGPKMQAAGAELIETTTAHAVMLGGAIGQAWAHYRRLKRLERWLAGHPIALLVPTDSPAANWSICKLVRRRQPRAKIVHLAAPQVWAWASWRIGKLRRLTDHVLCLLPFEPAWFAARGVPGTFVGHPIFEKSTEPPAAAGSEGQSGALRLALLPGSRAGELKWNWPVMAAAFVELRKRRPGLTGTVAAVDEAAAKRIAAMGAGLPAGVDIKVAQTDEVIAGSDAVLVVSGTAMLQVAAHGKPMVGIYNVSWLTWNLVGRWLVATRTFSLPNIISESSGQGRVVTELMPHFRAVGPVVDEVDRLLGDAGVRVRQRAELARVCEPFRARRFGPAAAEKALEVMDRGGAPGS